MDNPNAEISFVPAKEGEILRLAGGVICRIQEDGSKTGISLLLRSFMSEELIYVCR